MKKLKNLAGITLVLLYSKPLTANELFECRNIENNTQRLSCYDESIDNKLRSNKKIKIPIKNPKATLKTSKEGTIRNDAPSFGLEEKKLRTKIASKIVGEFKGWDKNTKFELANGQIWKVVRGSVRTYSHRPVVNDIEVTINKGFLDSYKLSIAGTNRTVKVRRIR